ncbi:MAG: DUF1684 domain-containing protein [Bacteroidales bacterium]|nr:DUF1684 domain-containing protein [Bacteroidales bacterium]
MSKNTLSYADQINQQRLEKDNLFKNSATSPLTSLSLSTFTGLSYFPVDERYRISGILVKDSTPAVVQLNTSTGRNVGVERFGIARFGFDGKSFELVVYKTGNLNDFADAPGQLFIPFKDLTSGIQSHPAGRYLLISVNEGSNQVELDFNKAFNPLNSYNPALESIIAPEENMAGLSFTVGQRKFEDRK